MLRVVSYGLHGRLQVGGSNLTLPKCRSLSTSPWDLEASLAARPRWLYGKRPGVLPVLEKGEIRARALRSWKRGTPGRWHIHCAIELPSHFDAITLENLIGECWAKVEWGYGRILVRDGANAGWINYMLKGRQKSEFDGFLDFIIIESLHNPIADA